MRNVVGRGGVLPLSRLERQQHATDARRPRLGPPRARRAARYSYREEESDRPGRRRLPWEVSLFLVGLVVPWMFWLGPLRLSVYRIALLIVIMPCLFMWLTGRAGRIRTADIALLIFWLWSTLSLAIHHGLDTAIQSGGILFIETVGAYLVARCYVRDADDFRNVAKLLFAIVAVLLPFALLELVTGRKPLIEVSRLVFDTVIINEDDPRMGLWRVQGPFEHPILFGVCCGSILAMTHLVLGHNKAPFRRWLGTGSVALAAFCSLSSGPMVALSVQGLLLLWDWLLKNVQARWRILWGLFGAFYTFIAIASNQSVYGFVVAHAPLFDKQTAYYRLLIWKYGSASILAHPFFGIGFNEYERESWMVPSVDMFWIVHSLMFGLPAGLMFILAFVSIIWAVGLKKGLDQRTVRYRTAFLICMAGFFTAGWAVHFWNATYVWFMFLLGSGVWILDVDSEGTGASRRSAWTRGVNARDFVPGNAAGSRSRPVEPHAGGVGDGTAPGKVETSSR